MGGVRPWRIARWAHNPKVRGEAVQRFTAIRPPLLELGDFLRALMFGYNSIAVWITTGFQIGMESSQIASILGPRLGFLPVLVF